MEALLHRVEREKERPVTVHIFQRTSQSVISLRMMLKMVKGRELLRARVDCGDG